MEIPEQTRGLDDVTIRAREVSPGRFEANFSPTSSTHPARQGFTVDTRRGARGGEFETGSLTIQVVDVAKTGRDFAPSTGAIALHVDDVDAARSELESRGVEFKGETMDSGVCYQAYFEDQDGNALILHHRY